MKRTPLVLAGILAASALVAAGSASTAEAAGPTAVYERVEPSRPMANERFVVVWDLSTAFQRETRLQTISGGSWKTIRITPSDNGRAWFRDVHSSKTRQYRVYVPKATYNGRTYPSYSSSAKTLRVFPQTVNAFATPDEQCGTREEIVPFILAAQFEPRRYGRTVTFESAEGVHPTITARTDARGNVAVALPELPGTNQDFQTTVTAESFNGSATNSITLSYRNVENRCSWFQPQD
jgi:hypothetical protein